jgi:hypothetical protein
MSRLQAASSTTNSQYPFENIEGNLFNSVCLKSHWDPTQMLRHILPQQKVNLPQDFRPWVKVCKNYVTSGPAIEAPMPPKNMVFPSGGSVYPPGRYSANIDKESVLRTLDHPLDKWCPSTQYIPRQDSNMYVAGSTVPERKAISNAFVSELSMPQALLRTDVYTCRSENDTKYFERSGRMFNNPTKMDRYGADKYYALPNANHGRGEPMPHGGVNQVKPTRQAMISKGPFPQPGGALPMTSKSLSRPISGYGSTVAPGAIPPGKNCTSFVGVATCGSAAPVW